MDLVMFDDTMNGPLAAIFGEPVKAPEPKPAEPRPQAHPNVWARKDNVTYVDFNKKGG